MTHWYKLFGGKANQKLTKKMKKIMKRRLKAEEILMSGMAAVWMVIFLSTAVGSGSEILKNLKSGITVDWWMTKMEIVVALTAVSLLVLCVTTIWQIHGKEADNSRNGSHS